MYMYTKEINKTILCWMFSFTIPCVNPCRQETEMKFRHHIDCQRCFHTEHTEYDYWSQDNASLKCVRLYWMDSLKMHFSNAPVINFYSWCLLTFEKKKTRNFVLHDIQEVNTIYNVFVYFNIHENSSGKTICIIKLTFINKIQDTNNIKKNMLSWHFCQFFFQSIYIFLK